MRLFEEDISKIKMVAFRTVGTLVEFLKLVALHPLGKNLYVFRMNCLRKDSKVNKTSLEECSGHFQKALLPFFQHLGNDDVTVFTANGEEEWKKIRSTFSLSQESLPNPKNLLCIKVLANVAVLMGLVPEPMEGEELEDESYLSFHLVGYDFTPSKQADRKPRYRDEKFLFSFDNKKLLSSQTAFILDSLRLPVRLAADIGLAYLLKLEDLEVEERVGTADFIY